MLDENAGNVGPGLAWRSYDNKLGMGANVDYLFSDKRDVVGFNAYVNYRFWARHSSGLRRMTDHPVLFFAFESTGFYRCFF